MMMSDSLPFTPYDSMEYESVQPIAPGPSASAGAPKGFEHRDSAAQKESTDIKKMASAGPQQMIMPVQQPKLVEEDIDIGPIKGPSQPDIGNYKQVYDILYIIVAVLIVDVAVIFLTRYSPEMFGASLNKWYDIFGLNAVIADVGIIVIGFIIARYVYTGYIKEKFAGGKWCPYKFVGTLVGVQLVHDLLFYYGVINQVPRGHNSMIDVFKDYSTGGPKILAGDAAMMVASAGIAMLLKAQPMHIVASTAALVTYTLPYILYTKNQYSVK
jgi:hypothetical protein